LKISTRGRYGLIALVDIAACEAGECINIKNIAKRQGLSVHYLEQLVSPLKKAGIIKSIRGAQGGYVLNRPAEDISVGEALEALEGPLYPVECLSGDHDQSCGSSGCDVCVTKTVWERLYERLNEVLTSITLAELVNDYKPRKEQTM